MPFFSNLTAQISDLKTQASDRFLEVIEAQKQGLIASAESSIKSAGTSAWDSIVGVFRKSETGQAIEKTATQQKVREVLSSPVSWVIAAVVAAGLFFGIKAIFGKR